MPFHYSKLLIDPVKCKQKQPLLQCFTKPHILNITNNLRIKADIDVEATFARDKRPQLADKKNGDGYLKSIRKLKKC